ncbi:MFS general substrate transporter [Laetiporus sulphureus 93-53]|uniref:MFS general substrate transporter n=1 Tax=Laetiporus sulphureus 93-53 TaxID=1314785 RepID=A0A165CH35_9APHY|nr:MFS general substrate transporter [Laetiporus sulphureus 93-53]KZT02796.1 MFS general substrate transporter [Laetiporus sulphureus 93-53]
MTSPLRTNSALDKQVGTLTETAVQSDHPAQSVARKKTPAFWLIFFALCASLFLSALELTAVSTVLPTIAHDLHATEFIWVGSAYALSSTAFLPMSGNLAQIFGRRPALLVCLAIFALGSGICGGARNMNMLIAGRTVQGLGGGGIQSLSAIILADLVTLQERGLYAGLFGLTWSIAGMIGPIIGGSLADNGQWRWLFYLNLPICGLSAALVLAFLKLPTPPGTLSQKVTRIDWIGNVLVIASSSSTVIALTWGGVIAPWGSYRVLVPLVLGIIGFAAFMLYEALWAVNPIVPSALTSNRTSLSGYLQTFFVGVVALGIVYYYPVYFQGCKDASPIGSGVLILGVGTLAPSALIAGVMVNRARRYRPQMWAGWCLIMIGLGLFTTLTVESSRGKAVGYGVLVGVGIGFEYSTTLFPVQAPLTVKQNAHALAFLMFVRSFAGVWGMTIGSTVLQNELKRHLDSDFLAEFPTGAAIAYALIPEIPHLTPSLKLNAQTAFATSLKVFWEVLLGVGALGLLSSFLMKGLPLHTTLDEEWAMKERSRKEESREEAVLLSIPDNDFSVKSEP